MHSKGRKGTWIVNPKFQTIYATYKELINFGVYDKQRIGKAIRNLEKHGLVVVKTMKQSFIESPPGLFGGSGAYKRYAKIPKEYDKMMKESRKENDITSEKIIKGLKKDVIDPRERIVTLTPNGRFLVDILRGGETNDYFSSIQ